MISGFRHKGLREDTLPALNLSVAVFARALGVSRRMIHGTLAERASVTPEMALRLGAFLGNGPRLWIDLQVRHDICRCATTCGRPSSA